MKLKFVPAMLLILGVCANSLAAGDFAPQITVKRDYYGAALETKTQILFGAGQDAQSFAQLRQTLGPQAKPAVFMLYTSLKGNIAADFKRLSQELQTEEGQSGDRLILQIGLAMTTDGIPQSHYEQDVARGLYDEAIDTLCKAIRDLDRPVILRIGYEFNGSAWNGYLPASYKAAFIRVTQKLRAYKLDIATCWDAAAVTQFMGREMDFYPGDEWVDWWGINVFAAGELGAFTTENFLKNAAAHRKPVLIGESTPKDVGVLRGMEAWDGWFKPYFKMIATHPGIKAFCYINWDWSIYPQWKSWGDARLEKNPGIAGRFAEQIAAPIFQKGQGERQLRLAAGIPGTTPTCAAPTGLKALFKDGKVWLEWSGDPGARRWELSRNGELIGSAMANHYEDGDLSAGQAASYQVAAVNALGQPGPRSPAVSLEIPDSIERIGNGDFGDKLTDWDLATYNDGNASQEWTENPEPAIRVTVKSASVLWHVQLQQGLRIHHGKNYRLSFTIKADRDCKAISAIQLSHAPYSMALQKTVAVKTMPTDFSFDFQAAQSDDNYKLSFMLGENSGRTFEISSVSLIEY